MGILGQRLHQAERKREDYRQEQKRKMDELVRRQDVTDTGTYNASKRVLRKLNPGEIFSQGLKTSEIDFIHKEFEFLPFDPDYSYLIARFEGDKTLKLFDKPLIALLESYGCIRKDGDYLYNIDSIELLKELYSVVTNQKDNEAINSVIMGILKKYLLDDESSFFLRALDQEDKIVESKSSNIIKRLSELNLLPLIKPVDPYKQNDWVNEYSFILALNFFEVDAKDDESAEVKRIITFVENTIKNGPVKREFKYNQRTITDTLKELYKQENLWISNFEASNSVNIHELYNKYPDLKALVKLIIILRYLKTNHPFASGNYKKLERSLINSLISYIQKQVGNLTKDKNIYITSIINELIRLANPAAEKSAELASNSI